MYEEKVVTDSGSKEFIFKSWQNVSNRPKLPILGSKIIQIQVMKKFKFADKESRDAFNRFKDDCIDGKRFRDNYFDHSVVLEIPGFKETLIVSNKKLTCWVNLPCYFLAHLLLFGWVYRFLLKRKTDRMNITVEKQVSILEDKMEPTTLIFPSKMSGAPEPCEDQLAYPMAKLAIINHGTA